MNIGRIAERVFKLLKGYGLQIKIFDEVGMETIDPEEGVRFFSYSPNIMVSVDDEEIRINKNNEVSLEEIEKLSISLKQLAGEEMMNYTIKDFNKEIKPKSFSYKTKNNDNISEASLSRLSGFKKTSYQTLGEVKITYRHKQPVNEESPRTRTSHVKSITLECDGVKYAYPNNHVAGARAMARHLHEGGEWEDNVSSYIKETSTRFKTLVEFYKYANKNKSVMEGNESLISLVKENIQNIRGDFRKFTAPTTYVDYRTKFSEAVIAASDDGLDQLKDQYTMKHFDNNMESVLPYLSGILKEKEQYDDSIMETLDSDILMSSKPVFTTVLEFETPESRFAYKLRETANVIENESLSNFLSRVSEKIAMQQKLDEFEVNVVKRVLEKASVNEFEEAVVEDDIKEMSMIEEVCNNYEFKSLFR